MIGVVLLTTMATPYAYSDSTNHTSGTITDLEERISHLESRLDAQSEGVRLGEPDHIIKPEPRDLAPLILNAIMAGVFLFLLAGSFLYGW